MVGQGDGWSVRGRQVGQGDGRSIRGRQVGQGDGRSIRGTAGRQRRTDIAPVADIHPPPPRADVRVNCSSRRLSVPLRCGAVEVIKHDWSEASISATADRC